MAVLNCSRLGPLNRRRSAAAPPPAGSGLHVLEADPPPEGKLGRCHPLPLLLFPGFLYPSSFQSQPVRLQAAALSLPSRPRRRRRRRRFRRRAEEREAPLPSAVVAGQRGAESPPFGPSLRLPLQLHGEQPRCEAHRPAGAQVLALRPWKGGQSLDRNLRAGRGPDCADRRRWRRRGGRGWEEAGPEKIEGRDPRRAAYSGGEEDPGRQMPEEPEQAPGQSR